MAEILHQQRLLLELLSMSGNIAVPDSDNGTLLFKTLKECEASNWLALTQFGAGFNKAEITDSGRRAIKDRRGDRPASTSIDRRRASSR
jgi:hypothetical protein